MVYEITVQHDMPYSAKMAVQLIGKEGRGGGGAAHALLSVMYVRCC